jgi:hypothetical protein
MHTVYRRVKNLLLLPLVLGISKHYKTRVREIIALRSARNGVPFVNTLNSGTRVSGRVCKVSGRRTHDNLRHRSGVYQWNSMGLHAGPSDKKMRCLSAWHSVVSPW